MAIEHVLLPTTSDAWEQMLAKFDKEGRQGRRIFSIPTELPIETIDGERWVLPAGTKVFLFCFMTGSRATKDRFRQEGAFFLSDRVVSICGEFGRKPLKQPRPYNRSVLVTLFDSMRPVF